MPSELTLYTSDMRWRADLWAWTNNSQFYRGIGTRVAVYHEERPTGIFGGRVSDWDERPALIIRIRNVYSGVGPGVATREREWRNAAEAELKERSVRGPLRLPADGIPSAKGATALDINKVEGTVTIVIGHETLTGIVSASSVIGERVVPAAA